jgi:cytochrome P450
VTTPFETSKNLLISLDPFEHSKRRRVWDRAFTSAAVKSYDPMLHARVSQFVDQLELRVGQTLDISDWLGFLTVDFMGDFAFAGAFDFMKAGKDTHTFHELGPKALGAMEMFGTMPWLRPVVLTLPAGARAGKFNEMSLNAARKRQAGGSQIRDLFFYLVSWK